jgi:hypothetical protein
MPTTATQIPETSNSQLITKGPNSETAERMVIRKDIGQFDAKIAHYPEEVKEDVAFIYSLNQTEFSGQYAQIANLVRNEGRLNYSDQYFYQVLSGRYFRPDPKNPSRTLGSIENLKEVAAWLRNWAIFNSEAGGMPFIETPTWQEILDYYDAVSAPETVNKWGAIVGSTGTGKSRMTKRLELVRNHGSTRRIEATRGSLARFLMKLGWAFGVPLSAGSSERMERLADCVNSKRRIIIDNFQKLYDPRKHAIQATIDWLMEFQDDTQCTIFLSWTPIFTRAIGDGQDKAYFEQLVGRLGGLETIYELPEYTPMRDLRAIVERMQIAGGDRSVRILKEWSRLPGRQRILYGRLQKAYRLSRDEKSKCIKLSHLEAASTIPVPVIADEDDEGGAS